MAYSGSFRFDDYLTFFSSAAKLNSNFLWLRVAEPNSGFTQYGLTQSRNRRPVFAYTEASEGGTDMYLRPPAQRFLPNQVEISNTIRSLFVDSGRWIRNVILSELLNLPNKDAVKARLDQVAYEAGAFGSRFYGQEAGNKIRQIFLNYYENVHDMIEAYLKNDIADIEQHRTVMYQDADELAALLSHLNRYWDNETMRALLYVLIDDTVKQIQNIVSGDYANDIFAFDEYLNQSYRVSDELTYGILRQFQI